MNWIKTSLMVSLLLLGGSMYAQEHPDKKEHPENSEKDDKQAEKGLTIEEFADAAKKHIEKESEKNNGYFIVKDKKQEKKLKLKLKKVHRKRLSHLGGDKYFVCADFKGKDGNLYDIDIFMKGSSKKNLKEARKPMVHKVNGKPRFMWYEEDGVWKRKEKGGEEHPEHPDKEHPEKEHPEHPDN